MNVERRSCRISAFTMAKDDVFQHQKSRGMRDLLPSDMQRFRRVEQAFREGCVAYGYEEVKPPTIEYLSLFTALGTLTPGMVGRVYSFLDWDGWSGERVVLRPDSTIPVARLYVENLSPRAPIRLSYVTNSFVFEETGEKNRERWQCGAEFIGGASVVTEVEILQLAQDVISRLGFDGVRLQVCHAGLLKALIEELDLPSAEREQLVETVLDGDWRGLFERVAAVGSDKRYLLPLVDIRGNSAGYLENIRALAFDSGESFRQAIDQFIEVATLLDELEVKYEIDITAVRTFEYYTGICFQFLSPSGEKIGGGGRYDDLIPLMGGPDISACGFALYIDQLMGMMQEQAGTGRFVAVVCDESSPQVVRRTLEVAGAIRTVGGAAAVGICRGPEFTEMYRWVVRILPEDLDRVEVLDTETNERTVCTIADAVGRLMSQS